jgi:CxC1 like cysteine cluster associated with KDZ transposases
MSAVLNYCKCVPFLHTLVKCGFWPASALNVTTAVSMKLLNWLEALMLESHVSIQGFCRAVMWKNGLSESQVS